MRTTLTAAAIVVLVAIYSIVNSFIATINEMVDDHSSQTRLIVQEKWVLPSRIPVRYVNTIARLNGVEDWTTWSLYPGHLGEGGERVAGIATRFENLTEMHPGLEDVDPRSLEALRKDVMGAIVGKQLLESIDKRIGDRFTLNGYLHLGKNLEFRIVGTTASSTWSNFFLFRHDYFQMATGDTDYVNSMWLRVRDVEIGKNVGARIEGMYAKSPTELKVQTESAGMARVLGRVQSLVYIVNLITTVLLVNMLILLANSISITVRERTKEMAILKALGFGPLHIMSIVVGEGMLVGMASGLLGGVLAFGLSALNAADQLPFSIAYLKLFPVSMDCIFHAFAIGGSVGFMASAVPAWSARSVKAAEVFARVV